MTTEDVVIDVSQDWVLACDVQQRFMQGTGPAAGLADYSAQCCQMRALGGDCYDFIPLPQNRLALLIGDASGKGVAAALMMASIQASLRTAALFTDNDLAALFEIVNRQAYASSLADRYATLFYGVFDQNTRVLRYVNAGHNPPVLLREDGSIDWLEACGAPVGLFPGSLYREREIRLNPGDLLVAYTDGVVEATNSAGEEWGVQGLLDGLAHSGKSKDTESSETLVRRIFSAMNRFSGGSQTDDATVAVLRAA